MTTTQLETAKDVLNPIYRHELIDHWFGDREVFWTTDKEGENGHVADGYRSSEKNSVTVILAGERVHFQGNEARKLLRVGIPGIVDYN